MKPCARKDHLVVEEIEDELVVYDELRKRAHQLNRTASVVWRNCDGERTVADLAAILKRDLDPVADEDLVWLTLDQLSGSELLTEPIRRSLEEVRLSRRHFVRKVGVVGTLSLLIPVVSSIGVPTPAAALTACQTCTTCSTCTSCTTCGTCTFSTCTFGTCTFFTCTFGTCTFGTCTAGTCL